MPLRLSNPLHRKPVVADGLDDLARKYPRAGGNLGVVVVERAAAGVAAAQCLTRGADGRCVGRQVDLAVVYAGEGVLLVDDAGHRVGEAAAAYTVEHHGRNRHLTQVRLAARLRVDDLGQQVQLALRVAAAGRAG